MKQRSRVRAQSLEEEVLQGFFGMGTNVRAMSKGLLNEDVMAVYWADATESKTKRGIRVSAMIPVEEDVVYICAAIESKVGGMSVPSKVWEERLEATVEEFSSRTRDGKAWQDVGVPRFFERGFDAGPEWRDGQVLFWVRIPTEEYSPMIFDLIARVAMATAFEIVTALEGADEGAIRGGDR